MSSNTNLFTLNPKFFQTTTTSYYSNLSGDEFSSTKAAWVSEKHHFQVF